MTAPERIYRDETGLWSRNAAAFSTFSEVRVSPTGMEYIRVDIHEAEIDALQCALSLMNKTAEVMRKEIDALKAELAALKEGPDYKGVLFALCASLSLEDTIGDVWEDVIEALDQAGICADIGNMDEFQDVLKILPKPVMSLYGPVDEEDL